MANRDDLLLFTIAFFWFFLVSIWIFIFDKHRELEQWLIILTPLLYRPVFIVCGFFPDKFFIVRKRNNGIAQVHLSFRAKVSRLDKSYLNLFKKNLISIINRAFLENNTVIIESHLLNSSRICEIKLNLKQGYRYKLSSKKVPTWMRIGIKLEFLLKEWRLVYVGNDMLSIEIKKC
ncbi:hypothetical protein ABLA30_07020 [Xenorhabdus nematophila]|uniref:hypothetical protein n=1 Tax=Xenorhabdus nematophila TaxID=628 RepID=UPI0032B74686